MAERRARVLIVDDDESIRTVLSDALIDDGYEVRVAASAAAALRSVDELLPDVIVLDMRMPDDGPLFKAELVRRSLHAPIVAMSASQGGQQWADSIGVAFLAKPFRLDDVTAAVNAAVRDAIDASQGDG